MGSVRSGSRNASHAGIGDCAAPEERDDVDDPDESGAGRYCAHE